MSAVNKTYCKEKLKKTLQLLNTVEGICHNFTLKKNYNFKNSGEREAK